MLSPEEAIQYCRDQVYCANSEDCAACEVDVSERGCVNERDITNIDVAELIESQMLEIASLQTALAEKYTAALDTLL